MVCCGRRKDRGIPDFLHRLTWSKSADHHHHHHYCIPTRARRERPDAHVLDQSRTWEGRQDSRAIRATSCSDAGQGWDVKNGSIAGNLQTRRCKDDEIEACDLDFCRQAEICASEDQVLHLGSHALTSMHLQRQHQQEPRSLALLLTFPL